MANNPLVGCWGVIVGIVLIGFLGWMGFELLVQFFTTASLEGVDRALLDAVFHHMTGEFLVVVGIIAATYIGVFRGRAGIRRALPALRVVLWSGAAFNVAAMIGLASGRWSTWIVTLAIVGLGVPPLLGSLARPEPTPQP